MGVRVGVGGSGVAVTVGGAGVPVGGCTVPVAVATGVGVASSTLVHPSMASSSAATMRLNTNSARCLFNLPISATVRVFANPVDSGGHQLSLGGYSAPALIKH